MAAIPLLVIENVIEDNLNSSATNCNLDAVTSNSTIKISSSSISLTNERPVTLAIELAATSHSAGNLFVMSGGGNNIASLISPSLSPVSAASGGGSGGVGGGSSSSSTTASSTFLPDMPQWKRDLIQRRKQNVARTLNAISPTNNNISSGMLTSAAAAVNAGGGRGGSGGVSGFNLNTSTSSSSIRSLAGSYTDIDQLAADGVQTTIRDFNIKSSMATALGTVNKQHDMQSSLIKMPATQQRQQQQHSPTKLIKEKSELLLLGGQYTVQPSIVTKPTTTTGTTTAKETEDDHKDHHHHHYYKQQHPINVERKSVMHEPQPPQATNIKPKQEIFYKTKEQQQQSNKYAPNVTKSEQQQQQPHLTEDQEINMFYDPKKEEKEQESNNYSCAILTSTTRVQPLVKGTTRLTGSPSIQSTLLTTNTNSAAETNQKRKERDGIANKREQTQYYTQDKIIKAVTGSGSSSQSLIKCESERTHSGKISQKLQENQFIKNEQQKIVVAIDTDVNNLKQQQQQSTGSVAKCKNKFIKHKNINGSGNNGNINSQYQPAVAAKVSCAAATAAASYSSYAFGNNNKNETGSPTTLVASSLANNCAFSYNPHKKKMVAVQEMKKTNNTQNSTHFSAAGVCVGAGSGGGGGGVVRSTTLRSIEQSNNSSSNLDNNEDLSYGPGIVSKLRCRYLSLALRESMEKERFNKDKLRRSTSLNTLLDNHDDDDDDDGEEEDEDENDGEVDRNHQRNEDLVKSQLMSNTANNKNVSISILKNQPSVTNASNIRHIVNTSSDTYLKAYEQRLMSSTTQGSPGVGVTFTQTSVLNRSSRHLKRGNDSLKRARSVEALLCEKSTWQQRSMSTTTDTTNGTSAYVTIEDKIHNARERLHQGSDHMPPKRLPSIIDDTERPPPDLVKQTLKMFEATANRRPRFVTKGNSKGDVATKVETFKNIIKEQKPVVTYPKAPSLSSPNKKANLTTSTPLGYKKCLTDVHQQQPASPTKGRFVTPPSTPTSPSNSINKTITANTNHSNNSNSGLLLEQTPDIIPRLREKQKEREKLNLTTPVVDSPVTALTKQIEKLSLSDNKTIPAAKFQQQQQQQQPQLQKLYEGAGQKKNDSEHVEGGAGGDAYRQSIPEINNKELNINKTLSLTTFSTTTTTTTNSTDQINNEEKNNEDNNKHTQHLSMSIEGGGGGGNSSSNSSSSGGGSVRFNNKTQQSLNNSSLAVSGEGIKVHTRSKSRSPINNKTNNAIERVIKTDNVKQTREYDNCGSGGGSDSNLEKEEEEYGETKRITRAALDNIAKAGTTQQYKFSIITSSTTITTSTTLSSSPSSSTTTASGKQVGVIRPLLNTAHHTNTVTATVTTTIKQDSQVSHNAAVVAACTSSMETLKRTASPLAATATTPTTTTMPPLTTREIEKNRINELKKTSSAATASSLSQSPSNKHNITAALDTVINTQIEKPTTSHNIYGVGGSSSDIETVISATNSPLWAMRKRRQTPPVAAAENTSMVFNFSNRKEVPDYIENDGVIFRRRRELPKPNESGFVLMGDLSVETSTTDMEYDEFSLGPPSPCDVEFVNANIVIDGKSSIKQKPKDATFRVQFNDTLTSTFEYPSEASLILDDDSSFTDDDYCHTLSSDADFIAGIDGAGSDDDFNRSFQKLALEHQSKRDFNSVRGGIRSNQQQQQHHHHHVTVDEIIQLPTTAASIVATNASNSSLAANQISKSTDSTATATSSSTTTSGTKTTLGNLPLAIDQPHPQQYVDHLSLLKWESKKNYSNYANCTKSEIIATKPTKISAEEPTASQMLASTNPKVDNLQNHCNNETRILEKLGKIPQQPVTAIEQQQRRRELTLPLVIQNHPLQQKSAEPITNETDKPLKSNKKTYNLMATHKLFEMKATAPTDNSLTQDLKKEESIQVKQHEGQKCHKTILNKPQYTCFLKEQHCTLKTRQRTRSNDFPQNSSTFKTNTIVSRSTSFHSIQNSIVALSSNHNLNVNDSKVAENVDTTFHFSLDSSKLNSELDSSHTPNILEASLITIPRPVLRNSTLKLLKETSNITTEDELKDFREGSPSHLSKPLKEINNQESLDSFKSFEDLGPISTTVHELSNKQEKLPITSILSSPTLIRDLYLNTNSVSQHQTNDEPKIAQEVVKNLDLEIISNSLKDIVYNIKESASDTKQKIKVATAKTTLKSALETKAVVDLLQQFPKESVTSNSITSKDNLFEGPLDCDNDQFTEKNIKKNQYQLEKTTSTDKLNCGNLNINNEYLESSNPTLTDEYHEESNIAENRIQEIQAEPQKVSSNILNNNIDSFKGTSEENFLENQLIPNISFSDNVNPSTRNLNDKHKEIDFTHVKHIQELEPKSKKIFPDKIDNNVDGSGNTSEENNNENNLPKIHPTPNTGSSSHELFENLEKEKLKTYETSKEKCNEKNLLKNQPIPGSSTNVDKNLELSSDILIEKHNENNYETEVIFQGIQSKPKMYTSNTLNEILDSPGETAKKSNNFPYMNKPKVQPKLKNNFPHKFNQNSTHSFNYSIENYKKSDADLKKNASIIQTESHRASSDNLSVNLGDNYNEKNHLLEQKIQPKSETTIDSSKLNENLHSFKHNTIEKGLKENSNLAVKFSSNLTEKPITPKSCSLAKKNNSFHIYKDTVKFYEGLGKSVSGSTEKFTSRSLPKPLDLTNRYFPHFKLSDIANYENPNKNSIAEVSKEKESNNSKNDSVKNCIINVVDSNAYKVSSTTCTTYTQCNLHNCQNITTLSVDTTVKTLITNASPKNVLNTLTCEEELSRTHTTVIKSSDIPVKCCTTTNHKNDLIKANHPNITNSNISTITNINKNNIATTTTTTTTCHVSSSEVNSNHSITQNIITITSAQQLSRFGTVQKNLQTSSYLTTSSFSSSFSNSNTINCTAGRFNRPRETNNKYAAYDKNNNNNNNNTPTISTTTSSTLDNYNSNNYNQNNNNNKITFSTTAPLRRRIPGNTLYFV